jgi:hypothetical protein
VEGAFGRREPWRRWAVFFSGGPVWGHAWLTIDSKSLMLVPRLESWDKRMGGLTGLSPSDKPLIHLDRTVDVVHARLAPFWMNGSVLVRTVARIYVVSRLPWGRIKTEIIPALKYAGFDVVEHHTWVSGASDIAVSKGVRGMR